MAASDAASDAAADLASDLGGPGAGEHDLAAMLRTLTVQRRPGVFAYVSVVGPDAALIANAAAVVDEVEGVTLVLPAAVAREAGLVAVFEAAWLTLAVHSSLDAVGLTAAVSHALATAGIPCNVIAGTYHDHLLVPVARAADAEAVLTALAEGDLSA